MDSVGTASEVADVTCPGELSFLRTNIALRLPDSDCTANGTDIANAMQVSLNELLTTYCDAQYRTVTGVSFEYCDGGYYFSVRNLFYRI